MMTIGIDYICIKHSDINEWFFHKITTTWKIVMGRGDVRQGEIKGGSGRFHLGNAKKKEPWKFKVESLKISIDCNLKAYSMLQI